MVSGPPGYGYQPPPPYYAPALDTEKGVKHLNWAIIIYIFASLLVFFAMIVILVLIQDVLTSTDPDAWAEIVGPLVGAVGLICGGSVLLLVTLILGLLGLYEMYTGRNEFGEKHATYVSRAVILIVLYIVLLVVGTVVSFAFIGFVVYEDPDTLLADLRTSTIAVSAVEIVSDVVFALAIVYLVRELCDEKYKRYLWAGFYIAIAATLVGHIVSIVTLYAVDATGMTIDDVNQLSIFGSLAMGLSFIPFIFFFICYRHAHARVRSGEIQPDPRAFAAAYPAPPPYPVPPPYPQQPAYPPGPPRACPACGNPSQPGEIYCANCGARLG